MYPILLEFRCPKSKKSYFDNPNKYVLDLSVFLTVPGDVFAVCVRPDVSKRREHGWKFVVFEKYWDSSENCAQTGPVQME